MPWASSLHDYETEPREFPKFVSIGSAGVGPAFLGPEHAPFAIDNPRNALTLLKQMQSKRNQLDLLKQLDQPFSSAHDDHRMLR